MRNLPAIREPRSRKYRPKYIHLSVRLDPVTYSILEQASTMLGLNKSKIVRSAIWLTFILLDTRTTVRRLLKPEVLSRVESGGDEVFIDSIRDIEELISDLGLTY